MHTLVEIGLITSSYNPGIFHTRVRDETIVLAIHIDDCIITGSSQVIINKCKFLLNGHYSLTDLGPIHWILGIEVTHVRDNCTIFLCQPSYIDMILHCFNLQNANASGSPMVPGTTFDKSDSPSDMVDYWDAFAY